ncbi:ArsR family transcriptional regulator [Streptomyces sp. NPDC048275]|uniref:arsenate-mycothiol transferase ArsC n=1 Tax=Streptomyces sp. NPDC048275 TaxID=3155629 RepID=UPI00340D5471
MTGPAARRARPSPVVRTSSWSWSAYAPTPPSPPPPEPNSVLRPRSTSTRTASQGEPRGGTYLRLRVQALADTMPTPLRTAPRMVFVCTHNSARSHLAAALWKRHSTVPTASAGTQPAPRVHPRAVATARKHGLSLAAARTSHIDETLRPDDLVVAVCDNAHGSIQLGHRVPDRLQWSVPDPTRTGTDDAFADALNHLADRIDRLAPAVRPPGGSDD